MTEISIFADLPPSERLPVSDEHLAEVAAVASQLATEAYTTYAAERNADPAEMHWRRNCFHISRHVGVAMCRAGIPTRMREWHGPALSSHYFLRTGSVMVDPTWQQFLALPRADLPKVLVVPGDCLQAQVTEWGVPAQQHRVWLDSNDSRTKIWP